ncbi:MAG: ABC transporter permease subunit [Oscillospiraceae bacterium]|nr:ABC transporter permease subunit [Oscillospiraceae bacterium]
MFWIVLAGAAVLAVLFFLDWLTVKTDLPAAAGKVGFGLLSMRFSFHEISGLFSYFSASRYDVDPGFFSQLLSCAEVMLAVSLAAFACWIVSLAGYRSRKIRTGFAYAGFGLFAAGQLAFIAFVTYLDFRVVYMTDGHANGTVGSALPRLISLLAALLVLILLRDRARAGMAVSIRRDWQLYVLLLAAVAAIFIFCYLPMYGIQIVFRDYKPAFGITGSRWIGLTNFTEFFRSYFAPRLILNTLLLNVYGLLWSFPVPILMAILLNQLEWRRFKRFTQTAIYAPHFISPVVLVGMLMLFLRPDSGIVNQIIGTLGGTQVNFMMESSWFRSLFIGSGIWQSAGWNTILYIAALTAIDPGLYEAATIDGATKTQKIRFIDIPHLLPVIVMLLILNSGAMLVSNTDKALLMQTAGNMSRSDIIGVYVYTMGIRGGQFSFVAAINLLVNVINFAMIVSVNWMAKRLNQTGLF